MTWIQSSKNSTYAFFESDPADLLIVIVLLVLNILAAVCDQKLRRLFWWTHFLYVILAKSALWPKKAKCAAWRILDTNTPREQVKIIIEPVSSICLVNTSASDGAMTQFWLHYDMHYGNSEFCVETNNSAHRFHFSFGFSPLIWFEI